MIIITKHYRMDSWIEWQLSSSEAADLSMYGDWFDVSDRQGRVETAKAACDEQALTAIWREFATYAAERRVADRAAKSATVETPDERHWREALENHYDKRHDGF